MHCHYHRGQNASGLKELGGRLPLTDLIVWYWKDGLPRSRIHMFANRRGPRDRRQS